MPNLGICYFIGEWGWLDICFDLSGTNVRIFSFGRGKKKENVEEFDSILICET